MTEWTQTKSSPSDWRTKWLPKIPTCEELDVLRCPFAIESLEQRDCIPETYMQNLMHLQTGQEQAPWTGYYALHKGAKLAVSNCYSMWFKIQHCDNIWAAICPTRVDLNLQGNTLDGINTRELIASGKPLPASCMPSRALSRVLSQVSMHSEPERDELMRIPAGQSTETECQPPRRLRGTGSDPF
jgi:hypothetical protein